MKNNNGVTLLELLIAISLLTLIIFAGSGIFLSGMNLSLDAQYASQAYMNAQVVLMHIEKYVRDAATEFTISPDNKTLSFKVYDIDSRDFSQGPSITRQYAFSGDQITFTEGTKTTIFNHINDCYFDKFQNDGVVLKVKIKADDNSNSGKKNVYELNACVEAGLTASPAVYQ